jgi:hypothetical protein
MSDDLYPSDHMVASDADVALARKHGKLLRYDDGTCIVTGYSYNYTFYITDIENK